MTIGYLVRLFKNQPLRNQLRLAFLMMTGILVIISFGMVLIWRWAYIQQIDQNAYKDIKTIANNTTEQIKEVENLSYRLMDNHAIQNQLMEIADTSKEDTRSLIDLKNQLNNDVNDTLRNTRLIRSSYLFNAEKENLINFIANKENIINGYSVDDIIDALPEGPAKGQWFFSDNLAQGIYARKIFSTVDFSLKHVGTIIFSVDPSFFQLENQQLADYTGKSLFFLSYHDQIFSADQKDKEAKLFQGELAKQANRLNLSLNRMSTMNFQNQSYYLATDSYQDFTYYYLLPENRVMGDLNRLQLTLIIVSIPLMVLLIFIINKISNQLTRPITQLATQMSEIQKTKNIDSLKKLPLPKDRQDEIAVLYDSYNTMIGEINQLITDNYEMRILSQEVEFKSLQAQLDPHFLYNTLDSINWLAKANDQEQISEMVTSLAYLFRKKIDTESEFTSLMDELDIVNAYINIQKVRFGKRIEYIELVLVDDLTMSIPKLLIQPLIENVFKYAVNNMKNTCQLILSIELHGNDLVVNVSDNGPGFKPNFSIEKDGGIGLKNIQKRLALHYGPSAQLKIAKSVPYKKTVVSFNIPLKKSASLVTTEPTET